MATPTKTPASSSKGFNFELYRYDPSLPAAIIGVFTFGILTSLHVRRLYRARAFYFIPFSIGGVFETIGYCGRIWSHFNKEAIGGFVMQAILILVAPALFAASIYMILGRLVRTLQAENRLFIPAIWVSRIFVTGDVISFSLQAGGGGIQSAGTLAMFNLGQKIIVAGLFSQLGIFSIFIAASVTFHTQYAKMPTTLRRAIPWRRHLLTLYLTSALVLVRSIFRVVEYLQGNDGFIISHELFLYLFDMVLMLCVMIIFLLSYPDDLESLHAVKSQPRCFLTSDEVMLADISAPK